VVGLLALVVILSVVTGDDEIIEVGAFQGIGLPSEVERLPHANWCEILFDPVAESGRKSL
jgi:hypothetical protein